MKTDYLEVLKKRLLEIKNEEKLLESLIFLNTENETNTIIEDVNLSQHTPMTRTKIPKKGNNSWMDYVYQAMLFLKEQSKNEIKAFDVAELIQHSNQDIDYKTIIMAVRNKLFLMAKEGKILAKKSLTKKEGYVYSIKE